MSGLEANKIAAAILLAGLMFLVTGHLTDILYRPDLAPVARGYQVEVADNAASQAQAGAKPEPIVLPMGQLMAAASAESGEKIAKKCTICHSFEQGQPHRVGPNLWGTLMRKQATHEGFAYSKALLALGGVWDYAALFQMIMHPKLYVPGTKMTFQGMSNPKEIADIIAYLRQMGPQVPLPAADAILTIQPQP